MVCPAEFDTGAAKNMMILSVPEGDDKPLKYPLMFTVSDVVLINKMDTKSVFDFDDQAVQKRILKLNPQAKIFLSLPRPGRVWTQCAIGCGSKSGTGTHKYGGRRQWLKREN